MKKLIVTTLIMLVTVLAGACTVSTPTLTPTPTPPSTPTTTQEPGSLEQRLDRLVSQLEQQRQTLHIPGMAIAVVKGDKIVLARGFGVANIEKKTPVTPQTIFAIGSSTKAFTSALVGMLVDEGKMRWDDPITNYLPYFKLNILSDNKDAQVTIRDLLSHRTGFPRMGILSASGQIPREEILRATTSAEPYAGFREKFYYSNEVYMAAGIAAGKAAGSDWDTLISQRIFKPLGMNSSSTSFSQAQKDHRLSLGYLWDDDIKSYEYKPMRNVDNIAPAGAINSNVLDMAQWLRLQLGKGQYDGNRLISEEQLRETWKTQIEIAPGVSYGFGWMIREWEGQPVIEHGGNVDGFSAEVAMLPESNLGFVLLTNASVTPLQQLSINMVWEALLGKWTEGPAASYEPFIGKYIANFGSFKDIEFTVLVQNGRLAVDVPGQQIFELKEPDKEGKWYFMISNEIAVSFDRDVAGTITGMKLYQSGLTFELPRKGVEAKPDIPLGQLQKYLGSYNSKELAVTIKVVVQNNRLAVDWPGQMIFELFPPDKNGTWVFRASPTLTVMFNETTDGRVESLVFQQSGKEFTMTRVAGELLPTVEDILNLRQTASRKVAIENMGDFKMSGTIHSLQSGVKGTFATYVSDKGRYRVDSDYGRYGYSRTAVNGDRAWVESSFAPFDELHGKLLEQAKLGHPTVEESDWRDFYDSIQVTRSDSLGGQKVYVLELKRGDLPIETIFVSAATGDILKSVAVALQEGGIGITITTQYEDFREIDGLRIPFRAISSNEQTGRTFVQYDKIEINLNIDDQFFILKAPTK